MDLKEYITIIKKNAFFIIVLTLIGASVAFSSTKFLKSGYKTSAVYFLVISSQQNTSTNQKLDPTNITDTAVAVLSSPDFLNEVATNNLSLDAKKLAPQVIRLTLTSKDQQTSEKSLTPVVDKFNQKLASLISESSPKLEPVGVHGQSIHDVLNNKILAAFGATVGLLASLVIIAVVRYLKL